MTHQEKMHMHRLEFQVNRYKQKSRKLEKTLFSIKKEVQDLLEISKDNNMLTEKIMEG